MASERSGPCIERLLTSIEATEQIVINSHLLRITRPQIEPDVNYAQAVVSFP